MYGVIVLTVLFGSASPSLADGPGIRDVPATLEVDAVPDDRGVERAIEKVDARLKVSSGDTLVTAAADGLGVIIAPDWLVCEEADAGRLVPVLGEWEAEPLELHAVWSGTSKLRGKAKFFVEFLGDALREHPPVPCHVEPLIRV